MCCGFEQTEANGPCMVAIMFMKWERGSVAGSEEAGAFDAAIFRRGMWTAKNLLIYLVHNDPLTTQ